MVLPGGSGMFCRWLILPCGRPGRLMVLPGGSGMFCRWLILPGGRPGRLMVLPGHSGRPDSQLSLFSFGLQIIIRLPLQPERKNHLYEKPVSHVGEFSQKHPLGEEKCVFFSKKFATQRKMPIFAFPNGNGVVAQMVEQWTENPCVGSSILPDTTPRAGDQNPGHPLFLYIFPVPTLSLSSCLCSCSLNSS